MAPIGTFVPQDAFLITGRGWVLTGQLVGQVSAGNFLLFANGISLPVKGVDLTSRSRHPSVAGLLVAVTFASRQEFIDHGILGATAQVVNLPTPAMLHLTRTTSENADFCVLVQLLDQDLARRDGAEHGFYAQFNQIARLSHVVVAYLADEAVGCGAFKELAPGTVEIKRMFVQPAQRGQGVAQAVLAELERWAGELDYAVCVLETGRRQPEAIALYHRCGYADTPNYGQYVGVENSVCMRKAISH